MAEQEKKILLQVDTGESQRTVKSLKQEISDLKDAILNLEKGSDAYNDAVEQLQDNQRQLNEVMALTKKEAVAVEGSYDALTHQMSLLRKEWKATGDEAKRNEIGKQIAEINSQLKEMDAEIGNYQRNVGNYVSHWEGMPEVTKDFGAAMREMNESIEPTKQKFEAVGKISSGIASGFAVVQGSMALLGVESENLEKTFVKLQAAMALMQGVKGIGDLVEGIGKAKVAFQGLGTTIKTVSKAMGATGWIAVIMAVVTAIIALVSWIKKTKEQTSGLAGDMKELNEMTIESVQAIGKQVGELKLYEKIATDITAAEELRVKAAKKVLEALGEEITETNIAAVANGDYADEINKVTQALIMKAKAEAAYGLVVKKYNEAFAERERLEQEARDYSAAAAKKEAEGASVGDWLSAALLNAAFAEGAGGIEGGQTAQTRKQDWVQEYQDKAAAAAAAAKQQIPNVDKWVEEFYESIKTEIDLSSLFDDDDKGDGNTKTPEQLRDELLAKIQEDMYNELINMKIEDIPIEDTPTKSTGYQYKDGDSEKRANIRIAQEERIANRQIELNSMVEQSEEERAAKEFEIRQGLEQKKLDLLKKYRDEAKANGDLLGMNELNQQIADKEIEIEKAKYEERLRLDEEYRKKKEKITNQINQSISAASSIVQGVLEITQAAYEKDGEISEKEAKKIKGIQIAIATMNMLQGITSALSGVFTTHTGVWDIAMAAAQATAIAAAGTANIMKIKNTDLTGSVPSGAQAAVTPNSNVFGTDIPYSYTRQLTGASEMDELNKTQKVVILESDIVESMNRVEVRQSESSF